jgi:hypothetical protein
MKGTMADYQIASVAETAIMDVYPYAADESITDTISENANSPVVRNFIQSLPEGCRTTITVGGKKSCSRQDRKRHHCYTRKAKRQ